MRTMEQSIHNGAIGLNYVAALMGVFGGVALLLSAIGVYGVMAHLGSDQKRTRSGSGWRSALAQRKVLGMILRRGMLTTGVGLEQLRLPLGLWIRAPDGMARLRSKRHRRDDLPLRAPLALVAAAALAVSRPSLAGPRRSIRSSRCGTE